jgi:hypothetical protein
VPSKAEAAAAAQADIPDKPNVVTFATIKTMATQMAYVAAYSGQLGKSTRSLKDVTPYRIIGTPTSANVYVNNSLVCAESPCILNIFGDHERKGAKWDVKFWNPQHDADSTPGIFSIRFNSPVQERNAK